METEPSLTSISRSMLHPEDATRLARSLRHDPHDRPRAASENSRPNGESRDLAAILNDSPPSVEADTTVQAARSDASLLSLEETTELFRNKLADAKQDTEHAMAGSEAMSDAVKPKLTLDLGHSSIARLPETVVDLIKAEVERLSLSHNHIWHIPLRFSECSHLRYLNIRSNAFREIPRGVYKLSLLEILDVSRNKVRRITKEVRNLGSLRVFSVVHNRVEDLPAELCELKNLQILKVAGNPLRFKLQKIVEVKEAEVAFSEMTDHERETAVTSEIKRYLRELRQVPPPIDIGAAAEAQDSPMETPKPQKRAPSSRFPVIPSTATGESNGDNVKSSPNQGNPPPIPTRSHYRMSSGQSIMMRRPGIAPLISNNERNRSNSESVLQASVVTRSKRMGMLRKEQLDSIDEAKMNRNSHLRGFSHASVLKKTGNMSSPAGGSSSSPNSPKDVRRQRFQFVKRLSSLPEHKGDNEWHNPMVEGAKGILYALYQIHPQISGLIAAIKGRDARRSSLEFTFYNASTHVDRLNEALEQADAVDPEDEEAVEKAEDTVQRDCQTCIMAYAHVTAQLQENVRKIVSGTDARYVRTLMLLLFGSMVEIRNAINSFGVDVRSKTRGHRRQISSGNTHAIQTIPEEFSTPQQPVRTATPTRDRVNPLRQGPRLRSDTTILHPSIESLSAYQIQGQYQQPKTAMLPTPGATVKSNIHTNHAPSFGNVSTLTSVSSFGLRSRSSSGNGMTNTSFSSVASTPRSVEGFNVHGSDLYAVRVNATTGLTDPQEEAIFERIFLALTSAYTAALQAIPLAKAQFIRCLDAAEENNQTKAVHSLWSTLIYRCKLCQDVSEALKLRLGNMRLTDPNAFEPGSGRNDPSFWPLVKTFMGSFVDMVAEMREARKLRLLPPEMVTILRPVQKATKEVSHLVETSPWKDMTDGAGFLPAATPFSSVSNAPPPVANLHAFMHSAGSMNGNVSAYSSALAQHHVHQARSPFPPPNAPVPSVPNTALAHANGVGGYLNGASPISVPLPATPLSAALGPAAQATVPTVPNTPASAYGDSFFKGDVFQRADSLMNMPQAGTVNFLARRG